VRPSALKDLHSKHASPEENPNHVRSYIPFRSFVCSRRHGR
jgi:hypothetical protein